MNKFKMVFFMLLVTILSIPGIMTVKAATISDDGEYSLVLSVNEENGIIDGGEYAKLIRFNVEPGEKTVKLSELTKGITPFNGKTEFSHWETLSERVKADEELALKDFNRNGSFYTSTGKETSYTNGLSLVARFSDKKLSETGNYYVTLDAFAGTINGKTKLLLESKSTEFTTIDLTKYTPVRKGYTFKGWDLNGKIVTSIDASAFSKDVSLNVTATYTKATFTGDDRVLILNANGGTIDGKTTNKYDYLGGADSGTSMSLLPYIPVREGYTFKEWNTKKNGSGKSYKYIYWRAWDKYENMDDVEKDTLIENGWGRQYYQNVTLYACWDKNQVETEETVKEIQSAGTIKAKIEFENEVNKDYKLSIEQIEVNKELTDKNVKFIADINVIDKDSRVVAINGIKMKIRIALPEDLTGYDHYEVIYILNGEVKETIPAKIEDGYIVFETSHLSQYGIVATKSGSTAGSGGESGSPAGTGEDTGSSTGGGEDTGSSTGSGGENASIAGIGENTGSSTGSGEESAPTTGSGEESSSVAAAGGESSSVAATSPKTGDTSNFALWIVLLFISGVAAVSTTVVSRKKNYNR